MRILRPNRRTLRRFTIVTASGFVVLLMVVWLLLNTGVGTRLALAYVRGRLAPNTTIEATSGELHGPLSLTGVRYSSDGISVDIDTVRIDWQLSSLLRRKLVVRELHVIGIEIDMRDSAVAGGAPISTETADEQDLPQVNLPVSILLPHCTLSRIVVLRGAEETDFALDSVVVALVAGADSVTVQRFGLFGPNNRGSVSGAVRLSGAYPFDFHFDWRASTRTHRLAGNGSLQGNMERLELRHESTAPIRATLSAHLDSVLSTRTFAATLIAEDFDLRDIDSTLAPARVGGELRANGDLSSFNAGADVRVTHAAIGRTDSRILLSRREETWYVDSLHVGFSNNPGRVTGQGTVTVVNGEPTLDATVRWMQLGWPLTEEPLITSTGRLRSRGTLNAYEIEGTTGVHGSRISDGSIRLLALGDRDSVGFSGSGEVLEGELSLAGLVEFARDMRWGVDIEARALDLSEVLPDTAALLSTFGLQARAYGVRSDSGVFGNVSVSNLSGQINNVPLRLRAEGRLRPNRFELDSANTETLDGTLAVNGTVRWGPRIEWDVAALAKEINPAPLMPDSADWTGTISATARFAGTVTPEGFSTTAVLDTVSGTLRGSELGAKAEVRTYGDAYAVDSLSIAWGTLKLFASGELSDRVNGRLELNAPDVAIAVPGASGRLRAAFEIDGERKLPTIVVRIGASDIQYGDYSVSELVGGGTLDFTSGGRFELSLDASEFTLPGQSLDTVVAGVTGTSGNHTIAFKALGTRGALTLAAVGGVYEWNWTGNLASASIADSVAGTWVLERPARLTVAWDSVTLRDQVCGVSQEARSCVAGSWRSDGSWWVNADARSFPLERFGPLLPPSVSVAGKLDVAANFRALEDGTFEGTGTVGANSGTVSLALRGGDQVLTYERGRVEITADSQGVRATVDIEARQDSAAGSTYADLSGSITLPGYRPLLDSVQRQPIEGRMSVSLSDLAWLEAVLPELVAVEGNLDSDLAVVGTVSDPQVTGEARMVGKAQVPRLGLNLHDIEFAAIGEGVEGIGLVGSLESGSGQLDFAGRWSAGSARDSTLIMHISGTRVQAASLPEAQVWMSPNLYLVAGGHQVSISGEVEVPRALIELRDIPALAVPVSRDAILVRDTIGEAPTLVDVFTSVRLVLGDSVSFRGFGLTGSPSGSLLAVDEPGRATTATGQLSIGQGRYKAYGQDLTIETGRVVFAGGPIDNPGLDIRAVRQAQDSVTAGLLVAGTLKVPELTVFSEPPMLQSEALAYLILGRPLSELSQSEGGQLTNAAASLGLRGGNMLAQRIGQRFGIDEARIETQGQWDEASFYAGKYLSPRLYVSYGIGLFDASSLFRIRYMLSNRWTLQAETGERTSTDINYRVERGR